MNDFRMGVIAGVIALLLGMLVGSISRGASAPDRPLDYAEAWHEAVSTGRPLAVWVGQPAQPIPGWVVCRYDGFPGVEPPCVVVAWGKNNDGDLIKITTFRGNPPASAVRSAVGPPLRLRSAWGIPSPACSS